MQTDPVNSSPSQLVVGRLQGTVAPRQTYSVTPLSSDQRELDTPIYAIQINQDSRVNATNVQTISGTNFERIFIDEDFYAIEQIVLDEEIPEEPSIHAMIMLDNHELIQRKRQIYRTIHLCFGITLLSVVVIVIILILLYPSTIYSDEQLHPPKRLR